MKELDLFCNDIRKRFPELSEVLMKKGKIICEIIIDYDVCGDTTIGNDIEFERKSIEELKGE